MAANKPGKATILAAFFDDGAYSPLFTDGAVSAAYGNANGQSVYVVFEDGTPVGVQDIEKNIRVLEMAAETGAPVVTFYDSTGAKLEGGLPVPAPAPMPSTPLPLTCASWLRTPSCS